MNQEQYEVINYRQTPNSVQVNAQAIAEFMNGKRRFEMPNFWVTCLDCGHGWKVAGHDWGFPHECPACGSNNTR
jgi:rubrerythrin